jgi:hypothetical protein
MRRLGLAAVALVLLTVAAASKRVALLIGNKDDKPDAGRPLYVRPQARHGGFLSE